MSSNSQFTIGHVEHIVQKSKEIGSDALTVVGVRSAEISCACGHHWMASDGNGLRNGVMGGPVVTCPSCGASEQVHIRLFRVP